MVERNQLKIADRNEVAEDDPFAELTRIMGFDPREPVTRSQAQSVVHEPVFEDDFGVDLEKELLGDFSPSDELAAVPQPAYTPAQPAYAPAQRAYAPVAAPQPAYQPEPEAAADDFAAVEFDALEQALQPEPAYASHEEPRFDEDIEAALADEQPYAPHDEPRFDADIEAALSDQPASCDEAALDFTVEPEDVAPAPQAAREPSFDDDMGAFEEELRATLGEAPAEEPLPYFPSRPQAVVAPEPVVAPVAVAASLEDELNALLGNMSAQTRQPEVARAPQPVEIPEPDFGDLDWTLDTAEQQPVAEAPRYAEEAAIEPEWAPDAAGIYAADEKDQPAFDDLELEFDDRQQEAAAIAPQVAAAAAVTAATVAPVVAAAPLVKGNGILSSMRSGAARAWGLSTPIAPRADGSAQPASERNGRSETAFAPIAAAAPVAAAATQPEPELDFSDADLDLFEQEMSFDEPEAFAAAPVEAPLAYEPEPVAYAPQSAYVPQQAYAPQVEQPQEPDLPDFDLDFGAEAQDDLEAELLAAVSKTTETVPDIETMDVPEQAVALADDLDLPEIAFEEAQQPSSFDDFDHDFGDLIGDMGNGQNNAGTSQAAFAAAAGAAGGYAMSYGRNEAPAAPQAPRATASSPSAYQFDEELFNNPARNDAGAVDDLDYDPDFDEAMATAEYGEGEKRSRKGLMLAAAVAAVAVIGGVGAFALSVGGGSGSGDATLVKADSEPLKVKPENPGGTVIPNQDNKVYDRVAGATGGSTTQKNLVNEAEEPVDIKPAPAEPENTAAATDAPKSEDRLEQVINEDDTPAAETAAVSPRKVRTMVVRADGSLAPREEPAGANVQANEPADPAPQRVATTTSNESTGAVAPTATQPDASQTALPPANRTTANTPATAPVAPPRPATQPVDVVGEVKPQQVAAAAPAATTAAAGAWAMQIASQPSEAAAQSTFQDLAKRYPGVLGGKQASIVKAEIAGKGTFWRVRIPAATRNDAISLCESYKAAGGNCFVSR